MSQSLSAVYIHLVFSTKHRQPFLRDPNVRTGSQAQLGGISKTLGCAPILTGGVEDHMHMLARFGHYYKGGLGQGIKARIESLAEG